MLETRRIEEELMDDPALDPAVYTKVLHDLAKVNRITMAHRPTLAFLDRAVGGRKSFRLLDVGFGDGDMLRQIARWASKRGIAAELVGIDLNANSVAAAREATPASLPITYRAGDYADLAGEGFDCIVSSLVAHHMTRGQLIEFLRFMDRQAAAGWLINDLHRHGFAYLGWPVLARVMGWHRIVRHDGHLSIARSYRPQEWPGLLDAAGVRGARVFRAFPFRLCVEGLR
ncbi:methyltransferase domain-containing protein [Allopontixanthobacter sediminis]|uniref:Methyltransferase domain-containing protein n=1 Tax=Allopontixanthobacter sediminis TaxID=1689985 RepID=A0A845AZ81_9SPHN|nr:methyltransferase domain-containing protein [Allopontixanthobacter sediminis]MXP43248.1 methyltransferase domain-containing protein [Allopontixanthobacter sediminis]